MSVKFVEVYDCGVGTTRRDYSLRTVFINPDYVVCLREDVDTNSLLKEGKLPTDLDKRQVFTCVSINKGTYGQDIIVVGPVEETYNKLNIEKRQLLKG
jgi:hypothetical protein|tara:strand:- start:1226 stop:1519 length:294 start_codon:yes stop_codon:yes gene_type:complete